ncbi:hypothetical protein DB346_08895 [Verrucomicrobia bacterium LW23]|nr:hypothetical protein DB346_08895 [Verrucomicrobia bacterium LW23]
MIETLLEPLRQPFMQEALFVGALVGVVCAMLSCFLVLKGWSLMGDAVSHAVLPGIVLAYIVGIPLVIGAFAFGLLCAAATGFVKDNSRIKEDTAMGVIFTGLFAFGLVLNSRVESDVHLMHVLFGNILGINWEDVVQSTAVCLLTIACILLFRKDLLLYCFDPNHARSIGLNVVFLHYMLLILLAATIVAALQAVGIILVVAMLITPGCIAYMLTDRFDRMLWIAIGSSVFACLTGTYSSFFTNASTSGSIVLTQSALFILAMVFGPKYGLLAQSRAFTPGPAGE